ncbi:MAG: LamG domain-containing protein, partial [Kiritimatiellae bacterium]|nr:LamG domain-containing protein [Kiritimatiellia bacterium]
VCDTSGKVLHTFPPRRVKLDEFRAETFSVPSTKFAGERGVVPRLRYKWAGREHSMNYGPMTVMDPSIRGYRMFWARSTRNQLEVDGPNDWRMDDAAPGGTHLPRRLGLSRFSAALSPVYQGHAKTVMGASRYGIRRDGQEFYFQDESKGFSCDFMLPTPHPGRALHWYTLEVQNGDGRKYQTLPIWETNGRRAAKVKVPIWKEDGSIAEYDIEGSRVPFWHYPVDHDDGRLLVDASGWGHNGCIRGSGYGGGHLGHTGYNHYHNGPVPTTLGGKFRSIFCRDADGRGYLSFNGSNDYVMVMGGTAFPGAFTYELSVRPTELGREVGLLSTAYNNQIQIWLANDGAVKVAHQSEREVVEGGKKVVRRKVDSLTSDVKLTPGRWVRLAVVYDLRTVRLFVDGAQAGAVSSPPARSAEFINHVVLGAKCGGLWSPTAHFKGDMRQVRMYGRNLSPSELIGARR